jgi:hypothetical protein
VKSTVKDPKKPTAIQGKKENGDAMTLYGMFREGGIRPDIYRKIRERLGLILLYLEYGVTGAAIDVLKDILRVVDFGPTDGGPTYPDCITNENLFQFKGKIYQRNIRRGEMPHECRRFEGSAGEENKLSAWQRISETEFVKKLVACKKALKKQEETHG